MMQISLYSIACCIFVFSYLKLERYKHKLEIKMFRKNSNTNYIQACLICMEIVFEIPMFKLYGFKQQFCEYIILSDDFYAVSRNQSAIN